MCCAVNQTHVGVCFWNSIGIFLLVLLVSWCLVFLVCSRPPRSSWKAGVLAEGETVKQMQVLWESES